MRKVIYYAARSAEVPARIIIEDAGKRPFKLKDGAGRRPASTQERTKSGGRWNSSQK